MFAYDSVGGGLGSAAIHTVGMTGPQLTQAIMANAIRVFNAGGMGLRGSGIEIGKLFKEQVQELYSQPGTGKPYKTKKTGAPTIHIPSVGGRPPARLTGALHDSVQYAVYRKPGRGGGGRFVPGFGKTEIVIYTRVPYAMDLESGISGKGKRKMAKRPAWLPVHIKWARPGAGQMLIAAAVQFGRPDNFIAAERRAAAAMMLGNPGGIFTREIAAGR
jgi:hypothetical protein